MSPPTPRNATDGDRSDPALTTAASSQPDTASTGHPPAPPAAAPRQTQTPRPAPGAPPPPPPPPPAGPRTPAVPQKTPRDRRAVAYREQRCLQAPHGPPRASGKGNGEGRPETDTLTVSSHATPPQPEPPRKTRSPAKT